MSKSIVIGITGRTGSGKSLACKWINETYEQVEHIDCDEIGHDVLELGAIKKKLIKTFGDSIIKKEKVNRKSLGKIVFNDADKLNELNEIVHPEICKKVEAIIKKTANTLVIVEGALIHQVGLEDICKATVCIDAPTQKIIERGDDKEIILKRQPKAKDYINMCTHTIKNNTSIELFQEKITKLFNKLIG